MLISVVMPVYNNAPYLKQSLESLLTQTHRDLQVVVVDDGSTDGSGDIAAATGDPRVRVVRRENGGSAAARNTGLDHLDPRTEAVTFHDGDDVSLPHRLQLQASVLERTGADGCYGGLLLVDPELSPIRHQSREPLQPHHVLEHLLREDNPWNNATWLVRRSALGGARHDESLAIGEDAVFWSHVVPHIRSVHVPEPVMLYRRHPGGQSSLEQLGDRLRWRQALIAAHRLEDLVPAAFRAFADPRDAAAVAWAEIGLAQARRGHLDDARERFQRATSGPVGAEAAAHVRAAVHLALGDDDAALDLLLGVESTALSLNHVGEVAAAGGATTVATSLFLEALRRDPDHYDPTRNLQLSATS